MNASAILIKLIWLSYSLQMKNFYSGEWSETWLKCIFENANVMLRTHPLWLSFVTIFCHYHVHHFHYYLYNNAFVGVKAGNCYSRVAAALLNYGKSWQEINCSLISTNQNTTRKYVIITRLFVLLNRIQRRHKRQHRLSGGRHIGLSDRNR